MNNRARNPRRPPQFYRRLYPRLHRRGGAATEAIILSRFAEVNSLCASLDGVVRAAVTDPRLLYRDKDRGKLCATVNSSPVRAELLSLFASMHRHPDSASVIALFEIVEQSMPTEVVGTAKSPLHAGDKLKIAAEREVYDALSIEVLNREKLYREIFDESPVLAHWCRSIAGAVVESFKKLSNGSGREWVRFAIAGTAVVETWLWDRGFRMGEHTGRPGDIAVGVTADMAGRVSGAVMCVALHTLRAKYPEAVTEISAELRKSWSWEFRGERLPCCDARLFTLYLMEKRGELECMGVTLERSAVAPAADVLTCGRAPVSRADFQQWVAFLPDQALRYSWSPVADTSRAVLAIDPQSSQYMLGVVQPLPAGETVVIRRGPSRFPRDIRYCVKENGEVYLTNMDRLFPFPEAGDTSGVCDQIRGGFVDGLQAVSRFFERYPEVYRLKQAYEIVDDDCQPIVFVAEGTDSALARELGWERLCDDAFELVARANGTRGLAGISAYRLPATEGLAVYDDSNGAPAPIPVSSEITKIKSLRRDIRTIMGDTYPGIDWLLSRFAMTFGIRADIGHGSHRVLIRNVDGIGEFKCPLALRYYTADRLPFGSLFKTLEQLRIPYDRFVTALRAVEGRDD